MDSLFATEEQNTENFERRIKKKKQSLKDMPQKFQCERRLSTMLSMVSTPIERRKSIVNIPNVNELSVEEKKDNTVKLPNSNIATPIHLNNENKTPILERKQELIVTDEGYKPIGSDKSTSDVDSSNEEDKNEDGGYKTMEEENNENDNSKSNNITDNEGKNDNIDGGYKPLGGNESNIEVMIKILAKRMRMRIQDKRKWRRIEQSSKSTGE